jgi:hypothetical protein
VFAAMYEIAVPGWLLALIGGVVLFGAVVLIAVLFVTSRRRE